MSIYFIHIPKSSAELRKRREESFGFFARTDENYQKQFSLTERVEIEPDHVLQQLTELQLKSGDALVLYSIDDIDGDDLSAFHRLIEKKIRVVFASEPWIDTDLYSGLSYSDACNLFDRTFNLTRRGKDKNAALSHQRRREGQLKRENPGAPRGKRKPSQNEIDCWRIIYSNSRYFKGNKTNHELMGPKYCGVAKNTFYVYKKHLEEYLEQGGDMETLSLYQLSAYDFT